MLTSAYQHDNSNYTDILMYADDNHVYHYSFTCEHAIAVPLRLMEISFLFEVRGNNRHSEMRA